MKKYLFLGVSLFNFTLYVSMRSIWSGIEGMFGIHILQFIFLFIVTALFLLALIQNHLKMNKIIQSILLGFSIFLTIALFYMFYLGIDSLRYFVRAFIDLLFVMLVAYFAYFMIFKFPSCKLSKNRLYKRILFSVFSLLLFVITFDLDFHFITNKPVVYAVEDTYQIVWTTSTHATAQVMVGDTTYYDLYAGSERSETTIHKVVVPMAELDEAKSYKISSTHVLYRGPYSGILGGRVEATFNFKPVDLTDGLNYYTISDTHTRNQAAIKAGSYFGDDLDFLILAGDIMNHIENAEDAEVILALAYGVTKGERPVIYARGNHEVKGTYANQLHRYVGSVDEKFFYTFQLNHVYGIVLDLGEDHDDSWWEYYNTAYYTQYRNDQTGFIQDIIDSNVFLDPSIEYRIGVCHIPVVLVEDDYLDAILNEWTPLLNQLNLNVMISGHKHQLLAFTTNIPTGVEFSYHENYRSNTVVGYRTNANFTNFIASRRSLIQSPSTKENLFGRVFTGLATSVSFTSRIASFQFTNSQGEIVSVIDPYDGTLHSSYEISLD